MKNRILVGLTILVFALISCTEECDCEIDNDGNVECPCDGNPFTVGENQELLIVDECEKL